MDVEQRSTIPDVSAPDVSAPDDSAAPSSQRTEKSTWIRAIWFLSAATAVTSAALLVVDPTFLGLDRSPGGKALISLVMGVSICYPLFDKIRKLIDERFLTRAASVIRTVLAVLLIAVVLAFATLNFVETARGNARPAALSGLETQLITNSVSLTWPAAPAGNGLREYVLRRNGVIIMSGRVTTFTDQGLLPGGKYVYTVSVIGSNGIESPPTSVVVTLPIQSSTLKPPVALIAQADDRSVRLSFTAVDGMPGGATYSVLRDGVKIGEAVGLSYTDTAVRPDTQYVYTVRTNDPAKNEQSVDSEAVTVRTSAAPTTTGAGGAPDPQAPEIRLPSAPQGLRRTGSTQTTISMAWSAAAEGSSALSGYRIYRDGRVLRNLGRATLTFQDSGLTAGTSYRYFVKAFDTAGRESAGSAVVTMSTSAAPPRAPTPFVRISPSSGSPTTSFHISGQGPANSFIVIYFTIGGEEYAVGGGIPTDSTGSFVSQQEGPNYYLLNREPGHEGEIYLDDYGYFPLVPGNSYTLKFREYAGKGGFNGSYTLTIT